MVPLCHDGLAHGVPLFAREEPLAARRINGPQRRHHPAQHGLAAGAPGQKLRPQPCARDGGPALFISGQRPIPTSHCDLIDMTFLHDTVCDMEESTLTERGQVSVPASVRKAMKLQPGQRLRWQRISDREVRISVAPSSPPGPLAVLGYARKLRKSARTTASWMRELREGEA